jgi:diacylglycerol kinase (ATP)
LLNKPKYNLFKNTNYAIAGLKDIYQNETSFKAQLIAFASLCVVALFLNLGYIKTSIMIVSLFLPLLCEVANSAIERTVDLVTLEYHELAKKAKDAGATMVFIAYIVVFVIWLLVIFY